MPDVEGTSQHRAVDRCVHDVVWGGSEGVLDLQDREGEAPGEFRFSEQLCERSAQGYEGLPRPGCVERVGVARCDNERSVVDEYWMGGFDRDTGVGDVDVNAGFLAEMDAGAAETFECLAGSGVASAPVFAGGEALSS